MARSYKKSCVHQRAMYAIANRSAPANPARASSHPVRAGHARDGKPYRTSGQCAPLKSAKPCSVLAKYCRAAGLQSRAWPAHTRNPACTSEQCTRLQTVALGTVLAARGPLVKVYKAMRALTIDQLFNHRLPFFIWLSMDGDHFTIRQRHF